MHGKHLQNHIKDLNIYGNTNFLKLYQVKLATRLISYKNFLYFCLNMQETN